MFDSIPSTPAFQIGTIPTRYSLHGKKDGPLIVFCNGIGASRTAWDDLLSILSAQYTCLIWAYDGTQASPTSDLTIKSQASILCGVLEKIDKSPFVLIGWSMGVQVALQTAHMHHTPPSGLILLNGASSHPTSDVLNQKWLWPIIHPLLERLQNSGSWLKRIGYEAQASPLFLKSFTQLFISTRCLSPELDRDAFIALLKLWLSVDLRHIARQLLLLDQSNNTDHANAFRGQTLIIAGATDPLVALHRTEELAQCLNNSELIVLNRSTHFTLMEQAQKLQKIVPAFLKKIELEKPL
ncbi:MAG: hypothetical protein CMK59_10985 [Proteobacteria bacterium]|nr:hypothetical protein [Pseudomonadota bacterium]